MIPESEFPYVLDADVVRGIIAGTVRQFDLSVRPSSGRPVEPDGLYISHAIEPGATIWVQEEFYSEWKRSTVHSLYANDAKPGRVVEAGPVLINNGKTLQATPKTPLLMYYRATHTGPLPPLLNFWSKAIWMQRAMSRLTLKITAVERFQEGEYPHRDHKFHIQFEVA